MAKIIITREEFQSVAAVFVELKKFATFDDACETLQAMGLGGLEGDCLVAEVAPETVVAMATAARPWAKPIKGIIESMVSGAKALGMLLKGLDDTLQPIWSAWANKALQEGRRSPAGRARRAKAIAEAKELLAEEAAGPVNEWGQI